jgi:hypothetical protein
MRESAAFASRIPRGLHDGAPAAPLTSPRCTGCGNGLAFDDWSQGIERCEACMPYGGTPAATYVRGPRPAGAAATHEPGNDDYERLLEAVPDELVEELIAALEEEAARLPLAETPAGPVREVLQEMGVGSSPREAPWAAWGFALGFAANVAIAKYAQMASGAPMGQFIVPLLIGGVVAGSACAAIGWGLARLRDR